jgi:hypothetical protein
MFKWIHWITRSLLLSSYTCIRETSRGDQKSHLEVLTNLHIFCAPEYDIYSLECGRSVCICASLASFSYLVFKNLSTVPGGNGCSNSKKHMAFKNKMFSKATVTIWLSSITQNTHASSSGTQLLRASGPRMRYLASNNILLTSNRWRLQG